MANQAFDDAGTQSTGSGSQSNTAQNTSGASPAGTTTQGKSGTKDAKKGESKPNRRWQNPLSSFASYTYNLSLYMVTPSAYDLFNTTGRKNITNLGTIGAGTKNQFTGITLIAQSGGIQNVGIQQSQTNSGIKRGKGFDLDYYIDNLKIKAAISGKQTQTASNSYELSFDIIEPYGFSFISNLQRAFAELKKEDKSKGYQNVKNSTRQFFILGVRFKGYDQNGNVVTSINQLGRQDTSREEATEAVFERYFDIIITDLTFKLDGRATVYNIQAAPVAQFVNYGAKRGILDKGAKVQGITVEQALEGLMAKLNADQQENVDEKKQDIANKYQIAFVGPTVNFLKDAALRSKGDTDKRNTPGPTVNSTSDVNPSTELSSSPNVVAKIIELKNSTPILDCIDLIIKQSDFLQRALQTVKRAEEEYDPDNPQDSDVTNKDPLTFYWYNVSVVTGQAKWDDKLCDFAYTMTYVIQTYATPVLLASQIKNLPPYYGPHKRYDYYFTGKNSEVISFSQKFNNTFFTVSVKPDNSGRDTGGDAQIPIGPDKRTSQQRIGLQGQGLEIQNQAITSLYDPQAYVEATIQIIGDPDFLMSMHPDALEGVYNQFYAADGYTVNPNGGQVFVEINFFEPIDYNNDSGLMNINKKIIFWKYPKNIQEDIDSRGGGVSYQVITIQSVFNNGRFTQTLSLVANTFSSSGKDKNTVEQGRPPTQTENTTSPVTEQRQANNNENVVGLKSEPPVNPTVDTSDSVENPTSSGSRENNLSADDDNNAGYSDLF